MRRGFLWGGRAAVVVAALVSVGPEARPEEPAPPPAAALPAAPPAAPAEPEAPARPATAATPLAVPATAPPAPAAATTTPLPPVRFIASTGWDYGFNELLKVQFEDGSTESLRLNGGFWLAVGAAFWPLRGGRLETRGAVGVKYDWISAQNGSARYLAFPVEVLEAFYLRPLRLSAGVSFLLAPSVKGKDFLADVDLDLRNSLGLVGQVEWLFPFKAGRSSLSAGARFTWQKLELEQGGVAEDASALGVVLGMTL